MINAALFAMFAILFITLCYAGLVHTETRTRKKRKYKLRTGIYLLLTIITTLLWSMLVFIDKWWHWV